MKLLLTLLLALFLGGTATAAVFPTPIPEVIVANGYQVAGTGAPGATVVSYTPRTDQVLCVRVAVSIKTADTVTVNVTYTRAIDSVAQTVAIINALAESTNTDDSASHCLNAKANTTVTVKLVSASTTTASGTILRDR